MADLSTLCRTGKVGTDPEFIRGNTGSACCKFRLASDIGWGDRKRTSWITVNIWGARAEKAAGLIKKGAALWVSGEFSDNERSGKVYLDLDAKDWGFVGPPDRKREVGSEPARPSGGAPSGDDDIPF